MKFNEMLEKSINAKDSLLCVGIDPDVSKVPGGAKKVVDFCKTYINWTFPYAAAFKPQFAYFSRFH